MFLDNEARHLASDQIDLVNHLIKVFLTASDDDIFAHLTSKQTQLESLYRDIKSRKLIQTVACASALSYISLIKDDRVKRNSISLLKTICYISTRKNLLEHFEHVIVRAFHASRILITKQQYIPLLATIDIELLNRTEQVKYFYTLNEKCKKAQTAGKHLIYDIYHLLSLYENETSGIRTKTKAREEDVTIEVTIKRKSSIVLDDDEHKVNSFQSAKEINSISINKEEYKVDSLTSKTFHEVDFSNTKYVDSLHLQQKQARNVVQHMNKREKQLACDYRLLSRCELQKVIKFYLENTDSIGACLTMIILFSGRTIEEIQHAIKPTPINANKGTEQSISYKLQLPLHKLERGLKKLVVPASHEISLALGVHYCRDFASQIASYDTMTLEQEVKATIKLINKSHNNRITISRLSNAFSAYLKHEQVDSAEAAYLLNREIRQTASCYYHIATSEHINNIYQKWLSYLFAERPPFITDNNDKDLVFIGSHLVVYRKKIKDLFFQLKDKLKHPVTMAKSLEEMHNNYVIFLILLLNLATGHRPVKNPFCFLNDFDTLTSRLFISDKENRGSLSARVLPLPPIISTYLKEYNEHLNNLLKLESPYSYDMGMKIKAVLASEIPYLFFLNEHTYEDVTPRLLDNKLKDIFPLPLNWNRHFIRSYLSHDNVNSHAIDAFMGHSNGTVEPFSKYSALGILDLKPVANSLQKLLSHDFELNENGLWKNGKD